MAAKSLPGKPAVDVTEKLALADENRNLRAYLTIEDMVELGGARLSARAWQPIETAPQDGTEVLLGWFGNGLNNSKSLAAMWVGDDGSTHGWTCASSDCGQTWMEDPTHWLPLPSDPEAA